MCEFVILLKIPPLRCLNYEHYTSTGLSELLLLFCRNNSAKDLSAFAESALAMKRMLHTHQSIAEERESDSSLPSKCHEFSFKCVAFSICLLHQILQYPQL